MRFYLEEQNAPSLHQSHLQKAIENHEQILSYSGIYRIINGKLYKYGVIKNKKDCRLPNYIENYTLLASGDDFTRYESTDNIPYEHIMQNIQLHKYKLHPQSQTIFIIEKYNNEIIDFYFESPHDALHQSLKEDIISLLSYLK